MREPWKSQRAGFRAGAGLDRYRVIQHLVKEPWKSQEVGVGAGAGLYCSVHGGLSPCEGAMKEPEVIVGAGAGMDR